MLGHTSSGQECVQHAQPTKRTLRDRALMTPASPIIGLERSEAAGLAITKMPPTLPA